MADPYTAHEILVAPARARGTLPRLLAGFALLVLVAYGLNAALQAAMITWFPDFWMRELAGAESQGASAPAMYLLLFSFAFIGIATMVATRIVYRRPALGVIGPLPLAVRQFWRVLRLLLLLGLLVFVLPPYDMGGDLVPNMAPGLWLALLPLSLLAILVQVGAEELLFRGFLQQGLAARFSSPLVWAVLPSALFAVGHYLPVEAGDNAWIVVAWAGVFGLLMADLTARAGTLGPAIAVHFVNNATSLLLVSVPDSLNGLALYTAPFSMADAEAMRAWLPVDFLAMLVGWLAARLALRR